MPRGTSRQSGLLDVDLSDDEELKGLVERAFNSEELAAQNKAARKAIKKVLEDRHPDAINAHRDGEHSGYVRVNGIRFLAKTTDRPGGKVEINVSPGKTWQQMGFEAID